MANISVKIPDGLNRDVERVVGTNTRFSNKSDFVRFAVREELQREYNRSQSENE